VPDTLLYRSPLVLDGRYCSRQPRPLARVALATNRAAFVCPVVPDLASIRDVYKTSATFNRVALVSPFVMVTSRVESRAPVLGVGWSIMVLMVGLAGSRRPARAVEWAC